MHAEYPGCPTVPGYTSYSDLNVLYNPVVDDTEISCYNGTWQYYGRQYNTGEYYAVVSDFVKERVEACNTTQGCKAFNLDIGAPLDGMKVNNVDRVWEMSAESSLGDWCYMYDSNINPFIVIVLFVHCAIHSSSGYSIRQPEFDLNIRKPGSRVFITGNATNISI